MRRLAVGITLGAALGFLAASAAGAQALDGKWWKRPRVAQELALSSDQEAELEKIFARTKPHLIDLRADLEKKQFDYEQSMQADSADRKTIEAKIEAREEARARLQKELAVMELDMKQVLKPDQREKLMRLKEEARQRLQERRRRFRDGDAAPPARQGQRKQGA
ncbi:MAG TPA: periplasmic heavy metal sensor [Thermoanaerobaculia bacterium]